MKKKEFLARERLNFDESTGSAFKADVLSETFEVYYEKSPEPQQSSVKGSKCPSGVFNMPSSMSCSSKLVFSFNVPTAW